MNRRYLSVCALWGVFSCLWQGLPEEVEKEVKEAKKQKKISVTEEESSVLEMLDKAGWKFMHKALESNHAEYIFVNSA